MKILIIILIFVNIVSLFAAEADHYTNRTDLLQDVSFEINTKANEFVQEGLSELNSAGSCLDKQSKNALYEKLRNYFANHSKGKLVKAVLYDDLAPIKVIPLKESVFSEWSIYNGYLLGKRSAATSPLALSPMIQFGEQLIGVDKLEHMFGMGFLYFKGHHLKGKNLKKVLKKGIFKEKTILGGNFLATGVFSYADLAANFNGMRFWNHVLQESDDVLGKDHNIGPYVKCINNEWKQVKLIDFRSYIDASMDESINCNKFATSRGFEKYKEAVEQRGFSCPMNMNTLDEMKKKYSSETHGDSKKRPISHWIINDEGLGQVSYLNEF